MHDGLKESDPEIAGIMVCFHNCLLLIVANQSLRRNVRSSASVNPSS